MAQNDIIRPARLSAPNADGNAPQNPPPASTFDISQLQNVIAEIVRRESREVFNSFMNQGADIDNDEDQTIDAGLDRNLGDMDRIPDVVKSLREFSGQPGEFSSWKKSVDRILKIYEHLKGTPKYYGILSVIRNKITGCADTALESYNTPLNWAKISKCLSLHYADKRDLGTLEYQMTTLVQKNETIPEFYQAVYYHLSLILNKLSSMDMSNESLNIMTQAYRDKALDTFVRGLKGDLPRLLSMKEPADLPQALHLCLKLENVHYRVQHSHGSFRAVQPMTPAPPIPPKRRNIFHPRQNRSQFYPELLHNPQAPPKINFSRPVQHPQQFQRQYPRPQMNNPLPKPEPMDIDHSLHSRAVNYQNRPQMRQLVNKRPPSHQMHQPNKFQRIYHTTDQISDEDNEAENYEYNQELIDYNEKFDQELGENEETQESDDVHFLD